MSLSKIALLEKKYGNKYSKKEYLINLFNGGLEIKHVYSAPIAPGNSRGNHYHNKKREYITVIRGQIKVELESLETGERADIILDASDGKVKRLEIKEKIAHRLENSGSSIAEVIILSTELYNEENPDVVLYEI